MMAEMAAEDKDNAVVFYQSMNKSTKKKKSEMLQIKYKLIEVGTLINLSKY